MKKAEFIGYLEALYDLAKDETFDDFDDGVEYVLKRIIAKANLLDESIQNVPYYPSYPQTYPVWPPTTWISTCSQIGSNVTKTLLPNPADWSINSNKDGAWSIVRKN